MLIVQERVVAYIICAPPY